MAPLIGLAAFLNSGIAGAQQATDPFRFFEGVTESVGTLKVMMHNPTHTRCVGRGAVQADGTLTLVQRVEDEGRPAYVRRWLIKQIAPGRFLGTMSEASGPVMIDQVGDRFRFRFKMHGSVAIEQWLTPLRDGRSATSNMIARKFGIAVASSEGFVRKVF